jgi:IclR family KDG regulon transcriptional repressor
MKKSPTTVRAVVRTADVIKLLSDGPKGVVEIANNLNLGQATVHRLLQTLDVTGFAVQDPVSRKYGLGPLLWKIAASPYRMHDALVACAQEEMKYLREMTGETVGLYVRVGTQRILLEELESRHQIKYAVEKGYAAPLYAGAPGRVLLSVLKEHELKVIVNHMELPLVGPNAVASKSALMEKVAETRECGYAVSSGEWVPGAMALSVPVKNDVCPLALSVYGPDSRFTNPMSILQEMLDCANRISNDILHQPRSRAENLGERD